MLETERDLERGISKSNSSSSSSASFTRSKSNSHSNINNGHLTDEREPNTNGNYNNSNVQPPQAPPLSYSSRNTMSTTTTTVRSGITTSDSNAIAVAAAADRQPPQLEESHKPELENREKIKVAEEEESEAEANHKTNDSNESNTVFENHRLHRQISSSNTSEVSHQNGSSVDESSSSSTGEPPPSNSQQQSLSQSQSQQPQTPAVIISQLSISTGESSTPVNTPSTVMSTGRSMHPPQVADPEPFPNPVIRRSHLRKVPIRITETVVEQRLVIHSGSGKFYEIGATLKKAIFGHVIHAIQITPSETNPEEFVRSGNQMAIKVYSKRLLRQLQGRTQENPLMEITALQYIGNDHPNLMGQIECCTDEENIYSVMRYCSGGELFDFIDENGPLSNEQAKRMFKQLIAGLQRLHELGIGHRDISLENILYDNNEIYVIIDFGMCLRLKKNPATSDYYYINRQQICGKKNYIAPEVLREDPIFNPMIADIWAAGIILFIILTGVPPIDKATHADIRYTMICEGRLQEMVTNWNIDMEPAVVDLIQRLLRADPIERLTISDILSHDWLREE